MKEIRIYREYTGDRYPWHVRIDGCAERDASVCNEDEQHGPCDDYSNYMQLLDDLESHVAVLEEV